MSNGVENIKFNYITCNGIGNPLGEIRTSSLAKTEAHSDGRIAVHCGQLDPASRTCRIAAEGWLNNACPYVQSETCGPSLADDMCAQPIRVLGLPLSILNVFNAAGIEKVDDLIRHSPGKLKRLERVGKDVIRRIREKLNPFGLDLQSEQPEEQTPSPWKTVFVYEGEDLSSEQIEILDLCARGRNALKNKNIKTIGELIKYSRRSLKSNNCGDKTLDDIESRLASAGLKLRVE